jgi:hypothetical protein
VKKCFALLCLLTLHTLAFGESAGQLSPDSMAALNVLSNAQVFYASPNERRQPSRIAEVSALKHLLAAEDREIAFTRLLQDGNLTGQLYALCGLFYANHDLFLEAVARYKSKDGNVVIESGSLETMVAARDLVFAKSRKAVRLDHPEQTLIEWLRIHRPKGRRGYIRDIVGGGYPAYFRDHWVLPHFQEGWSCCVESDS